MSDVIPLQTAGLSTELITALVVMVIYGVIVLAIGVYGGRATADDLVDYAVGGRNLGILAVGFTFGATYFSAFAFLGMVGYLYTHGIGFWVVGAHTAGFFALFAFIIGRRLWIMGKLYDHISLADFVGDFYDSDALRLLVSLAGAIFLVPYIGVQMTGAGYLFDSVTQGAIPFHYGAFAFLLLALAYVFIGGMRAIAWTDIVQGAFMYLAMVISLVLIINFEFGGIGPAFSTVAAERPEMLTFPGPAEFLTFPNAIGLWFVIGLGIMMSPHIILRMYTANSMRTFKWAMLVMGVFLVTFHFLTPVLATGVAATDPGIQNPDQIMPTYIMEYFPIAVAAAIIAGALAATMSTTDGQLHAASMVLTNDFVDNFLDKNYKGFSLSDRQYYITGRSLIVILGFLSFAGTFVIEGLLVFVTTVASAGFLQFLPLTVGALYWKRSSSAGALGGLVVGLLVVILLETGILPNPVAGFLAVPGMIALILNTIVFIGISMVVDPVSDESVQKYQNTVDEILTGTSDRQESEAGPDSVVNTIVNDD